MSHRWLRNGDRKNPQLYGEPSFPRRIGGRPSVGAVQMAAIAGRHEDNPLPGRKQESRTFAINQCHATTPGVHCAPVATVISRTTNPLSAPYSRASSGSPTWAVSAKIDGPAPESVAATPQRRIS